MSGALNVSDPNNPKVIQTSIGVSLKYSKEKLISGEIKSVTYEGTEIEVVNPKDKPNE